MKQTRPVNALWSDFRATYVQTLVSGQTVVGLLSRLLCDLWTDLSAILFSDQSVLQPIFRWSCESSVSPTLFFGSLHIVSVRQNIFSEPSRVTHLNLIDITILTEKCGPWEYFKSVVRPKKLCGHSATQKTSDLTNVWLKSLWSDYRATKTVRATLMRPRVCVILVRSTLSLIRPFSKLYIAIKPLQNTLEIIVVCFNYSNESFILLNLKLMKLVYLVKERTKIIKNIEVPVTFFWSSKLW